MRSIIIWNDKEQQYVADTTHQDESGNFNAHNVGKTVKEALHWIEHLRLLDPARYVG